MKSAIFELLGSVIYVTTPGNGLQAAWFGLGGVALGGLITTGFGFWLARKKERADEARERVQVRRAARLIEADIQWACSAARSCVEKKRWWYRGRPLTTEGWQQNRGAIAPELPRAAWTAVLVAIEATSHIQSARDRAAKLHQPDARDLDDVYITDPIPDDVVATLAPMLADLEAGRAALASLTAE